MYSETFKAGVIEQACERLAKGESLNKIAPDLGVSQGAFYSWIKDNQEFAEKYARARSVQADVLAEQIVDIADESPALIFRDVSDDGEGKTVISVDSAAVNHQRLRVDARKWFASKVAPKKYGDKIEVGSDPDKPLVHRVVTWEIVDAPTPKAA